MAAEKSTYLSLGQLLAFGVPGFVAFQAAAYHSHTAAAWLALALEKDQGVGVFLFVAVASIALGVVISGIRALVIDRLLCARLFGRWALTPSTIDYSRLAEAEKLAAYESINENYFRYYQFYANTLVAVALLALSRAVGRPATLTQRQETWAVAVLLILLLSSARDSFGRFCRAATQLVAQPRGDLGP